jgi:hypothetical protein
MMRKFIPLSIESVAPITSSMTWKKIIAREKIMLWLDKSDKNVTLNSRLCDGGYFNKDC